MLKIKSPKIQLIGNRPGEKIHETLLTSEERFFSLNGVKKEDYVTMWELLQQMGYNTDKDKDIHQQFLDRHNPSSKKPMKYKNRALSDRSQWYADGSKNPNKNVRIIKKTPTD